MKKTQLEKLKAAQIDSQMRRERGLIRESTAASVDRKEQRNRDRAAGLVPFAVKLRADLVKRIEELAKARQLTVHEMTAQLLDKALAGQ